MSEFNSYLLRLHSNFAQNSFTIEYFVQLVCLISVVLLGMEVLSFGVPTVFNHASKIPVRGKHLDKLSSVDLLYISINKLLTVAFVYHVIVVTPLMPSIKWASAEVTFSNTVLSLICLYLAYDFIYMLFHRFLHLRSVYAYIHKHHHRQKAPSRGNLDAINVHPFEYFVGEYLHLLIICVVPCHIFAAAVFILLGGVLATLNHTRCDVTLGSIYSVKVHDVHHRIPESNYGQYLMIWDRLFGTYRPYTEKDVEEKYQ